MNAAELDALLVAAVLASSLLAGIAIFVLGEARTRARTWVNLVAAVAKLGFVLWIAVRVADGRQPALRIPLLPEWDLLLRADALSLLFAVLSASLWLVTTVYAVAYLERGRDRARFFGLFSLCVTATMGVSMAGNLFTFFVFFEMLTLTTWPLVTHAGTRAAVAGGRTYLAYTLAGSASLLIGLIWLYGLAGPHDFLAEGGVRGVDPGNDAALRAIFVLLAAGMGVKAALVPLHGWLPRAMVAPAPVSALLHAVAVVKAGAFGLVRLVEDVYGPNLMAALGMDAWLAAIAAATILYGSLRALTQSDLKKRLAYSTVSQVSYVTLGVAIGGGMALTGALVHLVHQGIMKITLFFGAGTFAEVHGATQVHQLDGLGRRSPWTAAAFSLAALGMIGLPPLAGFVSKWYLGAGAVAQGATWVVAVLVISTLLNAAYFLPLLQRLWLRPAPDAAAHRGGAGARPGPEIGRLERLGLEAPAVTTAGMTLAAGLLAGHVLAPLVWAQRIVEGRSP